LKILAVAIPNHHFFQWVNQLKDSGHVVYWFDATGASGKSPKIPWVQQITDWKLRWDFPFRTRLKKNAPNLYRRIQKWNEVEVEHAFAKAYSQIQPDIVHCFEMKMAGIPILSVMQQNKTPFIYSSWGSDMYFQKELGMKENQVKVFLKRADFLITDCHRDKELAIRAGFKGGFLGVFPGNGGIELNQTAILPAHNRTMILIKGYNDGIGQAGKILEALERIDSGLLKRYQYVIYSADKGLEHYIINSSILKLLEFTIHSRYHQLHNTELLKIMGSSCIHIGNSLSDGMPNALLEAMGMGAFPIQSNPGHVTDEVIEHDKNGLLINDPLDVDEIAYHINKALNNLELRSKAQEINRNCIAQHYNRNTLRIKIKMLYEEVLSKAAHS